MADTNNDLTLDEARRPVPALHRSLAVGAAGHDVARLQAELRRAGLTPGTTDGVFGDRTAAAVTAFAARESLPLVDVTVDAALWSAILASGARTRADAIEAAARAHADAAELAHAAAATAQQSAIDKRSKAIPAGPDEQTAAQQLTEAAEHHRTAAARWLEVAELLAAHADPDGRGYKAYARHWAALEQARAHGKRAVNSLVLAGKDFDAADETDHREPFARATLVARDLAAL
jgi:hypothetical protein